jgi:hypothetical protein
MFWICIANAVFLTFFGQYAAASSFIVGAMLMIKIDDMKR